MNIALEQTEEHVNGIVTNRYGDAFIRGNNGALSFVGLKSRNLNNTANKYFISLQLNLCSSIGYFFPPISLQLLFLCINLQVTQRLLML